MKILNKYRFIRGKGKGGDAPIPRLTPPPDSQNFLKSISISDAVDALCEGPIYGLVDQFGRKVYGLDMLKGVYLNKVPVMNNIGQYNYRNILMEINLGTENQKPLSNFNHVYISKNSNFKLLGPVDPNDQDIRPNGSELSNPNVTPENFTKWAKGSGWPDMPQDPFVFVHHIRNADVSKLKVGLMIDQLFDTVSEGSAKGEAGKMGHQKRAAVELLLKYGVEGSSQVFEKRVIIDGIVTSPYAYMIDESSSSFSYANAGSRPPTNGTPGGTPPPNRNVGSGFPAPGGPFNDLWIFNPLPVPENPVAIGAF
jgi:hypothetical protein